MVRKVRRQINPILRTYQSLPEKVRNYFADNELEDSLIEMATRSLAPSVEVIDVERWREYTEHKNRIGNLWVSNRVYEKAIDCLTVAFGV